MLSLDFRGLGGRSISAPQRKRDPLQPILRSACRVLAGCSAICLSFCGLAVWRYAVNDLAYHVETDWSARVASAGRTREPYDIAYRDWTRAIVATSPEIESVYRYQAEVPNHVTLVVRSDAESQSDARAQAEHWYREFRDWRREHAVDRIDRVFHRPAEQCIAQIDDPSGNVLAWADRSGPKN